MTDPILTSLLRGRVLAAVTGTAAAGSSAVAAITGTVNEAVLLINALLALIAALAAIYSKLRDLRSSDLRKESGTLHPDVLSEDEIAELLYPNGRVPESVQANSKRKVN